MHWIQSILVFCSLFHPNGAKEVHYNRAKPIIIDTDIFSDVDDVGALAVANVLHNRGLADLRGVIIDTNSKYGALAASSINTYFGNGDIPIGALRPLTNETYFDDYQFLYVFALVFPLPYPLRHVGSINNRGDRYNNIAMPNTLPGYPTTGPAP